VLKRYLDVTTFLASSQHLANLPVVKSEDMSTCWPPRSPDLSPLDFLLWCRFKFAVYINPWRAFEALKERIQDKCEKIKLCTFGISSSRISFIPIVKSLTSLLSCFRYKVCCNTCRYKIRISRHTAAFISRLRRQCRYIWANAGG
jgi:hypothetical protein